MSRVEPRSPLAAGWTPGRHGAAVGEPVTITERRLSLVVVEAWRDRVEELAGRVSDALGLALPEPCRATLADGMTIAWVAPRCWIVAAPFKTEAELPARLRGIVGETASVRDQSHGKVCLRVAGPRARDTLDKVCRLDLHPRELGPGRAAVTPIAHVSTVLVPIDEAPTFDLLVPSTFARHMLESLEMAAEEFGYVLG